METSRRGIHRAVEQLDGTWYCLPDPHNNGRDHRWHAAVPDEAHPAPVPGIIQQVFPDHHGVAWYWAQIVPVRNPNPDGRYLLRFHAVDYRAEIWVNGERISMHDGGETPFVFDVTDSIRPGEKNLIAVRVINPTTDPIDGLTFGHTPHGAKGEENSAQSILNYGGITGSVELLCRPGLYVAELVARPNANTGRINILALVLNTSEMAVHASLRFAISPASGGETLQAGNAVRPLQPGQTLFETQLPLPEVRLWSDVDPYLYLLTAKLLPEPGGRGDEVSTRFAFRTFRLNNGYFRLNGKRFVWKGVRTLNDYPVTRSTPLEPQTFRRELSHLKAIGFNAVRFRAGMAKPAQLALCDELGLAVYEETSAATGLTRSPELETVFDRSVREMVLRDRNHACVVAWGLLSDTDDGPLFKHGVEALPMVSFLDESRLIFLNSGRGDGRADVGSFCDTGCADWDTSLHVTSDQPGMTGDVHLIPWLPISDADPQAPRRLGLGSEAMVFVSDTTVRGPVDLIDLCRRYQQMSRADSPDGRLYVQSLEQFMTDWEAFGMADVFGVPEEFFRRVCRRSSGRVAELIGALRGNPQIIGFTLGAVDEPTGGTGVLTAFRFPRPGSELIAEALQPLRWALRAEPACLYPEQETRLEANLVHEDNLPGNPLRALFQIRDASQRLIFEQAEAIESPGNGQTPLALPVLAQTIAAPAQAGRYRLLARLDDDATAGCDQTDFVVLPRPSTPSLPSPIVLWAADQVLGDWLEQQQIAYRLAHAQEGVERGSVILVSTNAERFSVRTAVNALNERAAEGSTVIFLDSEFFRFRDGTFGFFPVGELAKVTALRAEGDPVDAWARPHPIFAALCDDGGLLNDTIFRDLLPTVGFTNLERGATVIAAGHLCRMHPSAHRSGAVLSLHEKLEGRIILSAFPILSNLNRHPAADHLLLNLLSFASRR